jgi:hypothetical protein
MLFATGIRYYKVEMIEEFIIICVLDCVGISGHQSGVKIGEKFIINNYEYNYWGEGDSGYLRLPNLGLLPKSNFKKISDLRDAKIDDLLN